MKDWYLLFFIQLVIYEGSRVLPKQHLHTVGARENVSWKLTCVLVCLGTASSRRGSHARDGEGDADRSRPDLCSARRTRTIHTKCQKVRKLEDHFLFCFTLPWEWHWWLDVKKSRQHVKILLQWSLQSFHLKPLCENSWPRVTRKKWL